MMFDAQAIRRDFPILSRTMRGKPLVYLDNAATSQKPQAVLDALIDYYTTYNANIHRGIYELAERATDAYEAARDNVRRFIGARHSHELIFVRNTTEAINLVAHAWGRTHVKAGDEILLTHMEHHSNLVPWQMLAQAVGARVRYIPLRADGTLELEALDGLLSERTRLVALTQMSNVLGTINPVAEIARRAHRAGALILVDGAQSVPHLPVDVQELDCDFLAFSGHKMLGPTGIGALYARSAVLEGMEPFLGGGEMIRKVTWEGATWNDLPWKYEAGTPNIADGIAFGAAIDYLAELGMANVRCHEREITSYALRALAAVEDLTIYGPPDADVRGGVISFNLRAIHAHDVGQVLDSHGVAIRVGHHCAQPLMRELGVPATARASFYVYNTSDEVDTLIEGLRATQRLFSPVPAARRAV